MSLSLGSASCSSRLKICQFAIDKTWSAPTTAITHHVDWLLFLQFEVLFDVALRYIFEIHRTPFQASKLNSFDVKLDDVLMSISVAIFVRFLFLQMLAVETGADV